MSYLYEMNYKVILEANGLDRAHTRAREILGEIKQLDEVSDVSADIFPKHRNDLDHTFPEKRE